MSVNILGRLSVHILLIKSSPLGWHMPESWHEFAWLLSVELTKAFNGGSLVIASNHAFLYMSPCDEHVIVFPMSFQQPTLPPTVIHHVYEHPCHVLHMASCWTFVFTISNAVQNKIWWLHIWRRIPIFLSWQMLSNRLIPLGLMFDNQVHLLLKVLLTITKTLWL